MHRICSKLASLAVCLCVLAAAVPTAAASGTGGKSPWYQPYMDAFEQQGWLDGIAADGLQPNAPINRAAGLTQESGKIADYRDVSADSPYRADLAKALAAGYMGGVSASAMSPDGPLTREGATAMAAAGYVNGSDGKFEPKRHLTLAKTAPSLLEKPWERQRI